MNIERKDFLTVAGLPPARLDVQETAWAIPRLLQAMTFRSWSARACSSRWCARRKRSSISPTVTLLKLRDDPQWLARASEAVTKHWQRKNAGRANEQADIALSAA